MLVTIQLGIFNNLTPKSTVMQSPQLTKAFEFETSRVCTHPCCEFCSLYLLLLTCWRNNEPLQHHRRAIPTLLQIIFCSSSSNLLFMLEMLPVSCIQLAIPIWLKVYALCRLGPQVTSLVPPCAPLPGFLPAVHPQCTTGKQWRGTCNCDLNGSWCSITLWWDTCLANHG